MLVNYNWKNKQEIFGNTFSSGNEQEEPCDQDTCPINICWELCEIELFYPDVLIQFCHKLRQVNPSFSSKKFRFQFCSSVRPSGRKFASFANVTRQRYIRDFRGKYNLRVYNRRNIARRNVGKNSQGNAGRNICKRVFVGHIEESSSGETKAIGGEPGRVEASRSDAAVRLARKCA